MRLPFRRGRNEQPADAPMSQADAAIDVPLKVAVRPNLLSDPDSHLFHALVSAMAADAFVMPKARLSDFLYLDGASKQLDHAIKMDRKWVDFLLCDPFSMRPLAVIERVDSDAEDAPVTTPRRDPFIAEALHQAGIVLLKVKPRRSYPIHQLRKLILSKVPSLGPNEDHAPQPLDLAAAKVQIDGSLGEATLRELSISDQSPIIKPSGAACSIDVKRPLVVAGRIASV